MRLAEINHLGWHKWAERIVSMLCDYHLIQSQFYFENSQTQYSITKVWEKVKSNLCRGEQQGEVQKPLSSWFIQKEVRSRFNSEHFVLVSLTQMLFQLAWQMAEARGEIPGHSRNRVDKVQLVTASTSPYTRHSLTPLQPRFICRFVESEKDFHAKVIQFSQTSDHFLCCPGRQG